MSTQEQLTPMTSCLTDHSVAKILAPSSDPGNSSTIPPRRRRRSPTAFSDVQKEAMEAVFSVNKYPDISTRERLAENLDVPEARIQVWFQNRRSRLHRSVRKGKGEPERKRDVPQMTSTQTPAPNVPFGMKPIVDYPYIYAYPAECQYPYWNSSPLMPSSCYQPAFYCVTPAFPPVVDPTYAMFQFPPGFVSGNRFEDAESRAADMTALQPQLSVSSFL